MKGSAGLFVLEFSFNKNELSENSTCKEYLQVQKEGGRIVRRKQKFYNLDAVISVGYRINSITGTKFRQWATKTGWSGLLSVE